MKYKITIPKPCHEDWHKMSKTQKGKFCASCSKEVIDFTQLSESKITKTISNSENLCGRFKNNQLNTEIAIVKDNSYPKVAACLALVSSLAVTTPVFTQSQKDTLEVVKIDNANFLKNLKGEEKYTTIKGKVSDNEGGLPGVTILLKNSHKGTETDFDGNFSIKIPNEKLNSAILVLSYLGYKKQEIEITNKKESLEIILEEDVSGEVVILGYVSVYKKPNIFKRIGNLFRKKENRKW